MFDSKTQRHKQEQKLLGAYIDKPALNELDLRALVAGKSRSALLLDIIADYSKKRPLSVVVKKAAQILYDAWDAKCQADPQISASLQVRRSVFYVMCEESREKLRKKKISTEHIDAIMQALRNLAKVG
jgi:hypothetical protein